MSQILNNAGDTQILMLSPNPPASSALVSPAYAYYNPPKLVTIPDGVQMIFSTIPACSEYERRAHGGRAHVGSVTSC